MKRSGDCCQGGTRRWRRWLWTLALAAAIPAAAQHRHGGHAPVTPEGGTPPAPRPSWDPPKPDRTIEIAVTEAGFEPAAVTARKGERIRLVVKRRTDKTCAREFILDEFLVWQRLPLNEAVTETFVVGRTGEFRFHCLAGTVSGVFTVVE